MLFQTIPPTTVDYGSSRATTEHNINNSADEHLSENEKDFTESSTPKKTVTIVDPTETKTSTGASKETDPLLSSQKTSIDA